MEVSDALPGAELVRAGVRDIREGVESIEALLVLVGAGAPGRIYLTGGASAVLRAWRVAQILRAIRDLEEKLPINVELASPRWRAAPPARMPRACSPLPSSPARISSDRFRSAFWW